MSDTSEPTSLEANRNLRLVRDTPKPPTPFIEAVETTVLAEITGNGDYSSELHLRWMRTIGGLIDRAQQ